MRTEAQTSAGGVACRERRGRVEVALIGVTAPGKPLRWQLPKGVVDPGETPEVTAVREVREEAGIDTDLLAPIETIEYWYVGGQGGERVRFHKRVHFFLLLYRSGDVADHDSEVAEARWVPIEQAVELLAFASERKVTERAGRILEGGE